MAHTTFLNNFTQIPPINLFSCGNSFDTLIPAITYCSGVLFLLTIGATSQFCSFHFRWHRTLFNKKIAGLVLVLTWPCIVTLAKRLGSIFAASEYGLKESNFHMVEGGHTLADEVPLYICYFFSLLPYHTAFYLYIRHKMHLRNVRNFEEIVRNLRNHMTEMSYTGQLGERDVTGWSLNLLRELVYTNVDTNKRYRLSVCRSCPGIYVHQEY